MKDYVQELEWNFAQRNMLLHYESQWNELQKNNLQKSSSRATVIVEPLLKTKWNQSVSNDLMDCNAYNYYVPSHTCTCLVDAMGNPVEYSEHCPAGCVAVAMAQIMKYWNYPVYLPTKSYQYDWCNMPDKLNYNYNPDYIKERNAIAHLLKDCGDKVDMDYCINNTCSSSAYANDARDAIVNDFGYSAIATLASKKSNVSNWTALLKSNLDIHFPIYYRGSGSGGHAFVCDGYNSDNEFHFNWGWGGTNDGWFTVDNLTPGYHNFNSDQQAIFYICPDGYPNYLKYCDFNLPLWTHYFIWNLLGHSVSDAHLSVPKTATVLESVPEGQGYPTSWHTIKAGQSAEYVAHEKVILKPGFKVEAGAHFVARIEPCEDCHSAKVKVQKSNNGVEVEEELYIAVGNGEIDSLNKSKTIAEEPQVYPNPTTGLLTIHTKNENSHIQIIELYNMQGTKLFTFSGNQGAFQEIDISHLPPQVYSLKIQVDGQVFTKKLILQK